MERHSLVSQLATPGQTYNYWGRIHADTEAVMIWNIIKPASGPAVRRLATMFTFVLAIARLGVAEWLAPGAYPSITMLAQWAYGVVFGLLFVGLLVTQGVHRVSLAGFIVSVVGAGAYVMLAVDVWPVVATAGTTHSWELH